MKNLQFNFRRGTHQVRVHHEGAHRSTVPSPTGRTAEEYCACCKGLFGTITVLEYCAPSPDNRVDCIAEPQIVECAESDLIAFRIVSRLTGRAVDVLRRRKALTRNFEDGTREHYCGRCI